MTDSCQSSDIDKVSSRWLHSRAGTALIKAHSDRREQLINNETQTREALDNRSFLLVNTKCIEDGLCVWVLSSFSKVK